jgi:hypothetical protein
MVAYWNSSKYENHWASHFEQNITMGSYGVGIWCAWCCWKACETCSSLVQKKRKEIQIFLFSHSAQTANKQFWSQEFLGASHTLFAQSCE